MGIVEFIHYQQHSPLSLLICADPTPTDRYCPLTVAVDYWLRKNNFSTFGKTHSLNGGEFPFYSSEHTHVPVHSATPFRSLALLGWLCVGVSKQTTFLLQPIESEDVPQECFNCLGVLPPQDQTRSATKDRQSRLLVPLSSCFPPGSGCAG